MIEGVAFQPRTRANELVTFECEFVRFRCMPNALYFGHNAGKLGQVRVALLHNSGFSRE